MQARARDRGQNKIPDSGDGDQIGQCILFSKPSAFRQARWLKSKAKPPSAAEAAAERSFSCPNTCRGSFTDCYRTPSTIAPRNANAAKKAIMFRLRVSSMLASRITFDIYRTDLRRPAGHSEAKKLLQCEGLGIASCQIQAVWRKLIRSVKELAWTQGRGPQGTWSYLSQLLAVSDWEVAEMLDIPA